MVALLGWRSDGLTEDGICAGVVELVDAPDSKSRLA